MYTVDVHHYTCSLLSIQEMLPSASVDIHLAASKALAEVVQKDLIPMHIFTATWLPLILKQLDSKEKSK